MAFTSAISVITACYNGAAFLETCVGSAIENHPATEVIIVDDGSTDDSLARAAALARRFPDRVVVVSQSNQGPAGARNTGIRLARGKYLCFLDVDDQHVPGFLDAAVEVLERDPGAVGVSCKIELINAHRPMEWWQREAMESSGPCNLVMRTEIVRQIGGFPIDPAFRGEAGGEDARFRKALLIFGTVPKIDRPLFRYRMRPGGYIDLFLDRASFSDGKIHLAYFTKEEQDGSIQTATLKYEIDVTSRALGRLTEKLKESVAAIEDFEPFAGTVGAIPGGLSPVECHALSWFARNWPIDGGIVQVGGDGRSLYSLAVAKRGGVTAIGCGAQMVGGVAAAPTITHRSELPEQVAPNWQGRVRILFVATLGGRGQLDVILKAWYPHVTRFGLVIVQGPIDMSAAGVAWGRLAQVRDLTILQKS